MSEDKAQMSLPSDRKLLDYEGIRPVTNLMIFIALKI